MKLEVPEEFVEFLRKIEREVAPGNVVNWLEWASENPEEAKHVAEAYGKLGRCGRHEFEVCLLLNYLPDEAARSAERRDKESRERRSLLSKVIASSKRGGYRFTMPNGVECTVVKEGDAYWFHFNVSGEKIGLLYSRRGLANALETLKENRVSQYKLEVVSYQGKYHKPWTNTAETLTKAIEENMDPRVLATVNP